MGYKSLLLIFLLSAIGYCDTGFRDTIQFTETDNSPKCMAGQVKVSPLSLTCSGNTATLLTFTTSFSQINLSSNQMLTHGTNPSTAYVFQVPDAQSLWIGQNQNVQSIFGTFGTFVGSGAGASGGGGGFSSGFGNGSCSALTSGQENSCFGYGAGAGVQDGYYGVYFGANADPSNIHGSAIVAIGGVDACYFNTVDNTLCIGYFSGQPTGLGIGTNQTTGAKNMFIGNFTGISGASQLNNVTALGYGVLAVYSGSTQIGGAQGTGLEQTVIASTVTFYNHINNSTTKAPTISACGVTPSGTVVGGDASGTISVGGGVVTACTLTFSVPYTNTPTCVVSDNSTAVAAAISSISNTAVTFSFSATLGAGKTYYHCFGNDTN